MGFGRSLGADLHCSSPRWDLHFHRNQSCPAARVSSSAYRELELKYSMPSECVMAPEVLLIDSERLSRFSRSELHRHVFPHRVHLIC